MANTCSFLDQFIFRGTRNLIKGAYSEALHLKDFAKKYFRKDLDQATKAALEEDYSRNYLPFKYYAIYSLFNTFLNQILYVIIELCRLW